VNSELTINEYGTKYWKLPNGYFHREDGPAIENKEGYRAWYINGLKYTEQEHRHEIRSRKLKKLL